MSIHWFLPNQTIEDFILPYADPSDIKKLIYDDPIYGTVTRLSYPGDFWYEIIIDPDNQMKAIRSNWHTVKQDGKRKFLP